MAKRYRCDKYKNCTNNECLHYHPHFKKISCKNSECEEFTVQKCVAHHVKDHRHNTPKRDLDKLNVNGKIDYNYDFEGRYSVL